MIIYHNMTGGGQRNKYLKDLFIQWRGLQAAYDEGLAKGDAVLAGAVWRNVFRAAPDVDVVVLAQVVSHIRKSLQKLDAISDEKMIMTAIRFDAPAAELDVVSRKSKLMDAPFEASPILDKPAGKKS